MCHPAVVLVAQAAATVTEVMGSVSEGRALNRAAQEQAKELEYQAGLEKQKKNIENANAENDLQRLGLEAQAERASALTSFAAQGQTIANGGFVQRYLDDSARVTAKEENVVKWNRDVASWGHDANANSLMNQSILTRMEGKRAKRASYYKAAGQIFEGIGQGTSSGLKMKK